MPDLPNPESRVEQYLANLTDGTTEIPKEPESRIEQYLDYLTKNGTVNYGTAPAAAAGMALVAKTIVDGKVTEWEFGDAGGLKIHICTSSEYGLTSRQPTISDPDEKTLYLVPAENGSSPDLFDEWAYVDGSWEKFGAIRIGSIDYTNLQNKPSINGVTLSGNKTSTDLNIPTAEDLPDLVDDWLDENISNPDSPPLDRSLSSSSAAAPADLVGEELTSIKQDLSEVQDKTEYKKLLNGWDTVNYETGYINSSGTLVSNQDFRSTDFIPVSQGDEIAYKLKGYLTTAWIVTAYDDSKTRVSDGSVIGSNSFSSSTYTVPSGVAYVRICSNSPSSANFSSETVNGTISESIKDRLSEKLDIKQSPSDAGKLLAVDADGNVVPQSVQTEIADNSITYEKLQKATAASVTQSKVNFWYYNNTKRTDGKSIEVIPPLKTAVKFEYPSGTNTYRVYYVSDDGTKMTYNNIDDSYCRMYTDTTNRIVYIVMLKAGKIYIPYEFGTTVYYPEDTVVSAIDKPYPTDFLKEDWQPEIMDITAKYPRRVFCVVGYNTSGVAQGLQVQIPTYHIPYIGWYKVAQNYSLLDSGWNWVKYVSGSRYFYNDGSYEYVQGNGTNVDVDPEYVGEGILDFNDMQVISKGDELDANKVFGHAVVCFGDSITSTGYPTKLSEIAKCVAINRGASGASSKYICEALTGVALSTGATPFDWSANPVDTAIIMAGYNDTYQGSIEGDIPSTSISDADNNWANYYALFSASKAGSGITTTTGNVGFMIEWLQANHPDVRILLCNYHNNTDAKPTRYSDVDTAVRALCEYYGIKYIDVRRTSGINKKNASTYTTDGLHPNDAGQMLIAKAILREM